MWMAISTFRLASSTSGSFGLDQLAAMRPATMSAPMTKQIAVQTTTRMTRLRRLVRGTLRRYPGDHLGGVGRKDESGLTSGSLPAADPGGEHPAGAPLTL